MKPAATPEAAIDAAVADLCSLYHAKGDLELMFVRQIAGAQFTLDALERSLIKLTTAAELDIPAIDRITRIQSREQRRMTVALKELKDLQERRSLIQRFPEQTQGLPPLANHFCHVGAQPIVAPFSTLMKTDLGLGQFAPQQHHNVLPLQQRR